MSANGYTYYAGIDIGGTKCAVLLGRVSNADGSIEVLERYAAPTDTKAGPYATIDGFDRYLAPMLAEHEIQAIGISCGGPLDSRKGLILSPPNLPGWDNIPIVEYLENKYHVPVRVQNDANACAVAEWKFGAGKDTQSMVFCTMGTGFGAGLILDGRLYAGISDLAGEVGHIRLSDQGPVGFTKRGSVEGFCSGGGIAQVGRTAALEVLQGGGSCGYCKSYAELDSISAKSIAEAADAGDAVAIAVYKEVGHYLGKFCAIVIDLLNPEKIVIGSVFARSGHLIREAMQEVIDRECIPTAAKACKVVPAALGEAIGDIAALSVASL